MNDEAVVGIFVSCVLITVGLVRVCEWLRAQPVRKAVEPRGAASSGSDSAGSAKREYL